MSATSPSSRRNSTILAAAAAALFLAPLALTPSSASAQTAAKAAAVKAPAKALDDATIVAIFDAANTVDIETGQLAAERGQSKEVRDFGAMLVRDHKMVRQLGRDLATKLKVTPTRPAADQAAADHASAMKKLRGLSGVAFDRAFLQHEVNFHKAVIDAVNTTLMPAIQNAEVKALVTKVAPAFQGHMMAAQTMLDRMSK